MARSPTSARPRARLPAGRLSRAIGRVTTSCCRLSRRALRRLLRRSLLDVRRRARTCADQEAPRDVTALFAFDPFRATGNELYFGLRMRHELLALHERTPLAGAQWKVEDMAATSESMARAITCVTPPGIVRRDPRFATDDRRSLTPLAIGAR